MKKNLFIAFEGLDGSGKSTQMIRLAEYILEKDKHNHVLVTREPYENRKIRKILKKDNNPYTEAEKLAKFFVEDRKKHFREVILPNLQKGIYVLTDRYSLSTFAYQQAQGVPLAKLLKMHRGIRIPDIIFLIDIDLEISSKRIKKDKKRQEEIKFEKDDVFREKLRQNYLNLVNLPKHRIFLIDGSKNEEKVFTQIKKIFDEYDEKSEN